MLPIPRALPSASSSSMKMMQGALALACTNRSRTRAAPRPTNISTNSDPLRLKNGTPLSPATALARSVLPVPGGPTSRMPRGILPPTRVKRSGSLRNSMISTSSCLDSSTPATSLKRTPTSFSMYILALFLPSDMKPGCWPCMRFIMKYQIPTKRKIGTTQESRSRMKVDSISPLNWTLWPDSSSERSGSTRMVRKAWGSAPVVGFMRPWMTLEVMATSVTRSSLSAFRKSLYATVLTAKAEKIAFWTMSTTQIPSRTYHMENLWCFSIRPPFRRVRERDTPPE